MALFAGSGIAIDLGSANTTIYLENEGIVLREPTCVLMQSEFGSDVLAVGDDAYELVGRTGGKSHLEFPIMDGAVTDADLAALVMIALCEKATGKRRLMEKSQLIVSMSQGLTKVETEALTKAVLSTGTKRPILVKTPLAAALGAGMPVDQPRATMAVVLGGGTTEIAVISSMGIVAARSMRTGSLSMDEAIVRWMRRNKNLIISLSTAEDLKCDMGYAALSGRDEEYELIPDEILESADSPENVIAVIEKPAQPPVDEEKESAFLKGKDAKTGKPVTVEVTADEVAKALEEPVRTILDAISDALARVPAEMASDVLETGISLSGGGALLSGLGQLLSDTTGVPVIVGDHPHEDVILGLARLAVEEKLLKGAMEQGSAEEI
ncbi:MAG: rod shape-determining protein [Clostridia bacterium]|nr:rod shape-determining protein [Clostridia bacterium]